MAGQIKQSTGAIGYVELAYAKENNLPFADIKNAAGTYITPSIDSVVAALASARSRTIFGSRWSMPPATTAYPIAGATWLLVYQQQKDHDKGEKMVQFLKWAFTDGQKMAPPWITRRCRTPSRRASSTGSTKSNIDLPPLPC